VLTTAGNTFYLNTETRESTWTIPDAVTKALEDAEKVENDLKLEKLKAEAELRLRAELEAAKVIAEEQQKQSQVRKRQAEEQLTKRDNAVRMAQDKEDQDAESDDSREMEEYEEYDPSLPRIMDPKAKTEIEPTHKQQKRNASPSIPVNKPPELSKEEGTAIFKVIISPTKFSLTHQLYL
jgi:hypothetical protein